MAPTDDPSTVPSQRLGLPGAPGPHPRTLGDPALLNLDALEEEAGGILPAAVADYYAGGAEGEISLTEATAAWRSWRLRPRVLRGISTPRLGTSLLGSEVRTPIGVAPWAYQSMAHPDGERGCARGAAAAGALMTVSTSASTPLDDVAATGPQAPKWFQLYARHSPAHTDDLARRAGQVGYRALVLTVDLPVIGRRLRDVANEAAMPTDLPPGNAARADSVPAECPPWTFDDIGHFAELSGLPVVVKGVLRGDDAARCVEAGASAVWVSTHGGRQADPVVSSAAALPEIAEAVGDDVEVYADGGIRSGADVLTALALGATAVFVGRPAIWGLATGGADGVSRVLDGLSAQLAHTMALCGLPDVRSVPRDTVTPAR
jgi:4-hydroxymandelate oxidase